MTSYTLERVFPHASPDRCFQLSQEALKQQGFSIWKTRPLAWFLVSHGELNGNKVESTIGCRPGGQVILTLKSHNVDDQGLTILAEEIMGLIERLIAD